MTSVADVTFALDLVSAALGLAVAAYFLRVWRISREARYLLFAIGLALLGAGFATATSSAFGSATRTDVWDHLRLLGQTGGGLVVLLTYLAARRTETGAVFVVLGATVASICVLAAILLFVVPPVAQLPDEPVTFAISHGVMMVSWSVTTVLAAHNAWLQPRPDRLLVPGAFACFAISKYTWVLVDLVHDPDLSLLIYPWRLLGLVLLLIALVPRRSQEARDGSA